MVENKTYAEGAPCWAQLLTRDAAAAERFYAALFGWECHDQGGWSTARLGGRPVAAITPFEQAADPPAWTVYLAVADLAAATARLEAAGGKLIEGPVAGYVLASDPAGATFALFQPGEFAGAGVTAEPGAMSWAEVNSPDGEVADAFYHAVLGYEREPVPTGGVDYMVYRSGGEPVCGRLRMDEHWEGVPSHWMVYFDTGDLDAACATVTRLGGQVPVEPFGSPYGRVAVVSHPAGGFFSLREPG
ncbi:VOC family protein [Nonomuraea sp. NPDC048826]|uniref:VOC family protein n=1 Tax=Nonomuraea sp. NPDC048826 TaxID=3364347 RepID=UPI0037245612